MRVLAFAIVATFSSAALATPPEAGDRQALEGLLAATGKAWNAQDPAALSRLYAQDGTARLGYASKPVAGQEALREFFRIALSSAPGTRHITRLENAEMIGSNAALLDAQITLERPGTGGTWQAVQVMRSNVVAVQQNGTQSARTPKLPHGSFRLTLGRRFVYQCSEGSNPSCAR